MDFTQERCRICLETTESYVSLHKKLAVDEDYVLISKILIHCGNVQVSHDDRKPQNACVACIENAKVAYKFKTMCMQSETTLNAELFNTIIFKLDPVEVKKEEDVIDIGEEEICNIKEEPSYLNIAEVSSEESNGSFIVCSNYRQEDNIQEEEEVCSQDGKDLFNDYDTDEQEDDLEDTDEQEGSSDGDVENAGATEKEGHNCPDCGKSFQLRAHLQKHFRRQHMLRKCRHCDFKAAGKDLRRHASQMHDDQKPLKCHSCAKQFFNQRTLKRHMISHSDIRNHVCVVCSKAFKTEGYLKKHMFMHKAWMREHSVEHRLELSEERPYPCTLCDKKFFAKGEQKKHMNTHTREQVFKCELCSQEFCRKTTLQRHLKRSEKRGKCYGKHAQTAQ